MSLVVIEGLDGSGKGTQTELLYERLKRSHSVKRITFPDYGSPSSSLVKMYLSGEFGKDPEAVNAYAASSFYAVDRYASFKTGWEKDYKNGTVILADRYATSNIIYQLGKLPPEEWDEYMAWAEDLEYKKLGIPRPDCVIYLDMPVDISQKLLLKRYSGQEDRKDIHEKDLDFLRECSKTAHFAAERLSWNVIPCADGDGPLPVEKIHENILNCICKANIGIKEDLL